MSWNPTDDVPRIVERLARLRDLLRDAPRRAAQIFDLLEPHYLPGEAGHRLLRRDLRSLESMGYRVERLTKPLRFAVTDGPHILADQDIDTLTYIRVMFAERNPLAPMVQQLLAGLTAQLPPNQHRRWERRPALRVLLTPAIDYSAHGDLLRWLDAAIVDRRQIAFHYCSRGSTMPIRHKRLDPYDLEYTDRHFFLLAYSHATKSVLTFRLDRIVNDPSLPSPERLREQQVPRREPRPIQFTYRLPASFADGGVSERFTTLGVRHEGAYVFVTASDPSPFRIMRTLLGYGEQAVLVDGPSELLARMRDIASQMAANYGVGPKLAAPE